MSEPESSELLTVGKITGCYGVKGWVKIHSYTEPVENFLSFGEWKIRRRGALESIEFDPRQQTADVDRSNNHFPRRMLPSRLELYKRESTTRDLMRDMLAKLKTGDDGADDGAGRDGRCAV